MNDTDIISELKTENAKLKIGRASCRERVFGLV